MVGEVSDVCVCVFSDGVTLRDSRDEKETSGVKGMDEQG